jgi:hypothetical protein
MLNQRPYGYEHSYAWLLAAFWLLGVLSAVWGLVLERRAASVKVLSSEQIFVTAAIGIVAPFGTVLVGEIDVVLFLAVIGWLVMVTIAWLRGTRVGAEGWYHRTIILTLLIAVEMSAEISKIWLYGGGYGGMPTPLDHIGFHHLLDGGIGWSCILLVLLLAWLPATVWTPSSQAPLTWQPLHQSQFWLLAALLTATLPAAIIGGWAAYVALSHQRDYGYLHSFAWLLALFWYLSALSAMRCFTLQRSR